MEKHTTPDENDDAFLTLDPQLDQESPISALPESKRPRHKKNRSTLETLKEQLKSSFKEAFSKPNSRAPSQQLQQKSRKSSNFQETVDQDYMVIPTERHQDDAFETNRIMTTETSDFRRLNPFTKRFDEMQEDEEEEKTELPKTVFLSTGGISPPRVEQEDQGMNSFKSLDPDKVSPKRTFNPKVVARWKSAKSAFNAVAFNKGAEEAFNRKLDLIMKGHTVSGTQKKVRRTWYIDPNNKFKQAWDLLISVTFIYYSIIAPIRWSQRLHSPSWIPADITLDVLTWIDIILFFFTAFRGNVGLIKENKQIALHYLRTFFIFDYVAAFPFYAINSDLYALKMLRAIHLPRTYKVLVNFAIASPRIMSLLSLLKAIVIFLVTLGFLTAFWIFPGESEPGKVTWMSKFNVTSDDSVPGILSLFLSGLHFVVATIATVGFGEVLPQTSLEHLLVMLFQFTGIMLTAFLQGQIQYVMKSDAKKQHREEETEFEAWLIRQEHARKKFRTDSTQNLSTASSEPSKDLITYFKFQHAQSYDCLTWSTEFFPILSPDLQDEVTMRLFSSVLNKFDVFFSFFENNGFKKEITTNLKPIMFNRREVISKRGDHSKGLYFVLKGHVHLEYKDIPLISLKPGSFFGETAVLDRKSILTYTVAGEFVQCLFIKKKQLIDICNRYPTEDNIMKKIIYERMDHNKQIIAKFFKETQNGFDGYSPRDGRNSLKPIVESRRGSTARKEPKKVFIKEVLKEPLETQATTKPEQQRPEQEGGVIITSLEEISVGQFRSTGDINAESCNYMSRPGSFSQRNVPPVFPISSNSIERALALNTLNFKPQVIKLSLGIQDPKPNIFIAPPTEVFDTGPQKAPAELQVSHGDDSSDPSLVVISEDENSSDAKKEDKKDSDDSDNEADGSDSDDDDDKLNNSLEVPLETIQPLFKDLSEHAQILEYIDERFSSFESRLKRIDLSSREKILKEWKDIRGIMKRCFGELKDLDTSP